MGVDQQRPKAVNFEDPKLGAVAHLLRKRFGPRERVLAVGCGDGSEALVLNKLLDAEIVGVDVIDEFHPDASERVALVRSDARELPFPEGSFDVVLSYHALEHIPQPEKALGEMRRVVRPNGGVWIGTPNRSRILGYVCSRNLSPRHKTLLNLTDWWARLRGRFRNELGEHAGFTRKELRALLESQFIAVEDQTSEYYALLYPRHRRLLHALERLRLDRYVYPSIYFAGQAPGRLET